MSQTVTQKQCTESKIGWVHQVHTLPSPCAHCAMSQAWPCRVAGLGGRIATRTHVPLRTSYAVSQCFPRPCRVCISTQPSGQAACLSRYAHSYRDTVPQQPGPRARTACPGVWADRIAAFLGSVVASPHCVAVPYRGRALLVQASPCAPMSRYSLLYRDSKERMCSSPSSCF